MRSKIILGALAAAAAFAVAAGAQDPIPEQFTTPDALPLQQPEPRAEIKVDAPDASVLARGGVYLRYHVTNMRIAPVLGAAALNVTPRLGHLHVTVDNLPWHWADFSGSPIVVFGLPPGPHTMQIALVDTNHKEIDQATVSFTIPGTKSGAK